MEKSDEVGMMNDYKKLISALRCSVSVCDGKCDENCPYRTLEEMKPDFPIKADVTINGIGYWASCDFDRMILDAADAVEQLVKERDAAIADLRKIAGCDFCILENASPYSCLKKECVHGENGNSAWEWRGVQKESE